MTIIILPTLPTRIPSPPLPPPPLPCPFPNIQDNTNPSLQNISVPDDESPAIPCPPAQPQAADAAQCSALVTVAAPATSDNCRVLSLSNDHNNTADASVPYPVGTTTVTWTVTDIHGNSNTCLQNISVTDDEKPAITCAPGQTQTADAGQCSALVTVAAPATSDNCRVLSLSNDHNNTADASDSYTLPTAPPPSLTLPLPQYPGQHQPLPAEHFCSR